MAATLRDGQLLSILANSNKYLRQAEQLLGVSENDLVAAINSLFVLLSEQFNGGSVTGYSGDNPLYSSMSSEAFKSSGDVEKAVNDAASGLNTLGSDASNFSSAYSTFTGDMSAYILAASQQGSMAQIVGAPGDALGTVIPDVQNFIGLSDNSYGCTWIKNQLEDQYLGGLPGSGTFLDLYLHHDLTWFQWLLTYDSVYYHEYYWELARMEIEAACNSMGGVYCDMYNSMPKTGPQLWSRGVKDVPTFTFDGIDTPDPIADLLVPHFGYLDANFSGDFPNSQAGNGVYGNLLYLSKLSPQSFESVLNAIETILKEVLAGGDVSDAVGALAAFVSKWQGIGLTQLKYQAPTLSGGFIPALANLSEEARTRIDDLIARVTKAPLPEVLGALGITDPREIVPAIQTLFSLLAGQFSGYGGDSANNPYVGDNPLFTGFQSDSLTAFKNLAGAMNNFQYNFSTLYDDISNFGTALSAYLGPIEAYLFSGGSGVTPIQKILGVPGGSTGAIPDIQGSFIGLADLSDHKLTWLYNELEDQFHGGQPGSGTFCDLWLNTMLPWLNWLATYDPGQQRYYWQILYGVIGVTCENGQPPPFCQMLASMPQHTPLIWSAGKKPLPTFSFDIGTRQDNKGTSSGIGWLTAHFGTADTEGQYTGDVTNTQEGKGMLGDLNAVSTQPSYSNVEGDLVPLNDVFSNEIDPAVTELTGFINDWSNQVLTALQYSSPSNPLTITIKDSGTEIQNIPCTDCQEMRQINGRRESYVDAVASGGAGGYSFSVVWLWSDGTESPGGSNSTGSFSMDWCYGSECPLVTGGQVQVTDSNGVVRFASFDV